MILGYDTITALTLDKAAAMRALGYEYAIRYCVPGNSKSITAREVEALHSAGLQIGLCWETTGSRARSGAAGGLVDGRTARAYAEELGAPEGTVIYFAVDYAAPPDDFDLIAAYMLAAQTACRPYRLGIYGPYGVIEEMEWREIGEAYWQCVAWSGGMWSPHAVIQQREGDVRTPVCTVDNNFCKNPADAGFWEGEGMIITGKTIRLYDNRAKKKTPAAILKETGAKGICNGGVFDLDTWKPGCHLKINGKVLAADQYKYWGYGIQDGKASLVQDYDDIPDYISCCCMVKDGRPETMIYRPDMGGARQRTAIGTLPDGTHWGYVTLSPTPPEQLQSFALSCGVRDAIMLDSGISSWGISPDGELRGGRLSPIYVLFFDGCPYPEPTRNVGRWCLFYTKDMAKWVQWQLNRNGATLEIDGKFGPLSDSALRAFQRTHVDEDGKPLDADGVCGRLTRQALKKGGAA